MYVSLFLNEKPYDSGDEGFLCPVYVGDFETFEELDDARQFIQDVLRPLLQAKIPGVYFYPEYVTDEGKVVDYQGLHEYFDVPYSSIHNYIIGFDEVD